MHPKDFLGYLEEIPRLMNKPVYWQQSNPGRWVRGLPSTYALEHGANGGVIRQLLLAGGLIDPDGVLAALASHGMPADNLSAGQGELFAQKLRQGLLAVEYTQAESAFRALLQSLWLDGNTDAGAQAQTAPARL